jgi:2-haloacid dehalogenase
LTNWSHETFPFALERYDFLALFDGIVMSGEERMVKPDPRFYHLLLSRYGLRTEECVFIDDALPNIKAASGLGITSIHYHAACDVWAELGDLGLPLSQNHHDSKLT